MKTKTAHSFLHNIKTVMNAPPKPLITTFLILFINIFPYHASSQTTPSLPAFYPIAEHSYDIKDGLPDLFVENVLLDKVGRLHMNTGGAGATAFGESYYEYDGTRTYLSGLDIKNPRFLYLQLEGKDSSGWMYGYILYRKGNGIAKDYSIIFWYDPLTRTTQNVEVDGMVRQVVLSEGDLYTLVQTKDEQHDILRISDGKATTVASFEVAYTAKLAITDQDFWVGTKPHAIYRISRKDGAIRHYPMPSEDRWIYSILTSPDQDVWITATLGNPAWSDKHSIAVYLWDHETDSFTTNPHKPAAWADDELSYAMAFKDAKGNILVSYRNKKKEYSATLLDAQQQRFDYTSVMSGHELVSGDDFKKGLIFHTPGLRFVEVALRNAVQKNTDIKNPRWMLEQDAQTILMSYGQTLSYQQERWVLHTQAEPCFHDAFSESDAAKDREGNSWFVGIFSKTPTVPVRKLMRYRLAQELCDTLFDLGANFSTHTSMRFDFLDNGQMVMGGHTGLYVWDKQSESPSLLAKPAIKYVPNQVFVGRNGFIWLATEIGLLKIDPQTGNQKSINLIPGETVNVMRVHEDKKGRLWLGTVMNGVLIYDPTSGKTQVIDHTNGLSNDIVVTLLEDDDGNIWAGTFYGISVLSPEGAVLGALYEKDGLANNECNRWSAMKMKDGRLCFGSVGGVSIIDPERWKASQVGGHPPTIYLSELYSDAPGAATDRDDFFEKFQQTQPIVLPATNRNLKLAFGLSNYASPEKNTFAYQIEGREEEWHFIGAQRKLSLNALPAGSYNILIKGSDGRGQWSDPPLVIPVRVEEFFYKKWWFLVLCAVPFVAFLLIELNRQRGERQRLETEVQNRTATIQEQAEKLLELDQAKTRLYTNITHEFRTPLTVIMGIAEQMKEGIGELGNWGIGELRARLNPIPQYPNTSIPPSPSSSATAAASSASSTKCSTCASSNQAPCPSTWHRMTSSVSSATRPNPSARWPMRSPSNSIS